MEWLKKLFDKRLSLKERIQKECWQYNETWHEEYGYDIHAWFMLPSRLSKTVRLTGIPTEEELFELTLSKIEELKKE